MLAKKNRIRKKKEFDRVFKKSKPVSSENLIIRSSLGQNIKFGFIVSNKVDKRSSRRNAIKRQLRAITREFFPKVKDGTNVVVMVKKDFPFPYDHSKIKEQYTGLLMRANVLND